MTERREYSPRSAGYTTLRVLDERERILRVVSRTTTEEVTRFKAYGHRSYKQA